MSLNVSCLSSLANSSAVGSLEALCCDYRCYGLSVRSAQTDTIEEELLYLRRFFVGLGSPVTALELFSRLSADSLIEFINRYRGEHGPGSCRWMQHSLRMFLGFAYCRSYVDRDLRALVPSVRQRKMGHVPRCMPDECIEALMTGIDRQTPVGLRDSAIMSLLVVYGVRGVQVRSLRLDEIHWEESRISFRAAKGGRAIEQYLTSEVGNRLADYIMHGRPESLHREVFLTSSKPYRPISSSSQLSAIVRRHVKKLDLDVPDGVSRGTHGFRHAFACRMTGRVPFKDVVDLLGHRDPSTTLIYGKTQVDDLRRAALPWPGGE